MKLPAAFFAATIAYAAVVAPASAQHHHPAAPMQHGGAAKSTPWPVRVDGSFRSMVHGQNYDARVKLGEVMHGQATEAVGALSGLRGEITAIDGQLIVSYGKPCRDCPQASAEQATLLVSARVRHWAPPQPLPADLAGAALDRHIVAQAKAAGIDLAQPFPVRLKGDLTGVKMHIIAAPNPKFAGHGSDHGMAEQEEIQAARIAGEVVGFYAPDNLRGIVTHPGEPFHYHWVDEDRKRTAHLDAFGMAKGALLYLPKP